MRTQISEHLAAKLRGRSWRADLELTPDEIAQLDAELAECKRVLGARKLEALRQSGPASCYRPGIREVAPHRVRRGGFDTSHGSD